MKEGITEHHETPAGSLRSCNTHRFMYVTCSVRGVSSDSKTDPRTA